MSSTHQDISADSTNDIKKVAKGAGISFIGSAFGRGLFFAAQLIIARFFSVEIFGLYTLGLVVVRITELIARLGLHSGGMRFVSIYRKDDHGRLKGVLINAFLLSFGSGIVMGGIVYLCASVIADTIFHKPALVEVIKAFAMCVPFMASMTVVAMSTQGFQTTKYSVLIRDIIQPSVNIVLLAFFILFGLHIFWVINAFVISHAIALFAGFYFITQQFPAIKKKSLKPIFETRKLLGYSTPLLFCGFLGFIMQWADIIMLGLMKASAEVGIFRAASQMPTFFMLALNASNSIYAPSIAEMFNRGQTQQMENIFKTSTRWVFLMTLPISLIIVFSAREVMTIFGSNYIEVGAPVLIILTIAQFINSVTGGVAFTLAMTGKQKIEMFNSLAMVIINIALNYFFIPIYGSYGAAIATGISIAAINLIRLLEVYFLFGIHPYNMSYIQGVLSGFISVIVLYFLLIYLSTYSNAIKLISNSFAVTAIFITCYIIKGINSEDKLVFNALAKKFRPKIRISRA